MNSKKRNELVQMGFAAINIAVPLIIGLVLYACVNPNAMIIKMVTQAGFRIESASHYRNDELIYSFVRCYMADILWSYALTISVGLVLRDNSLLITFIVATIFLVIIEMLQLTNSISGTFDIADIILEMLSSLLALIILRKFRKTEEANEKDI